MRGPLLIVVAFGVGCSTLLVLSKRLARVPVLGRSRRVARPGRARGSAHGGGRAQGHDRGVVLPVRLLVDPRVRQRGPPQRAWAAFSTPDSHRGHLPRCRSGCVPITSGGAVVNAGAAAAILLALGVGKDIAINFSLASGLCSSSARSSPRSAARLPERRRAPGCYALAGYCCSRGPTLRGRLGVEKAGMFGPLRCRACRNATASFTRRLSR